MASAVARPTYTYDDLERLAEGYPRQTLELIDGELIVSPAPIPIHQIISGNLFLAIGSIIKEGRLGQTFPAPIDIRFTADDVLQPDLCVVLADRLHIVGPKAIDGPPDLVVEVFSPSTRVRDIREKRATYARFGVPEYWTVDPDERSVTPENLAAGRYLARPVEDGIVRSSVVPGLAVSLADIFDGV